MPNLNDLVIKTRDMVWGGLTDPLSALADDYAPGAGTIRLQHRMNIGAGSLISAGLNTFYVTGSPADGMTFPVLSSADGGPDVALTANTRVLVKPKATTWRIFRELSDAIVDLASPKSGVFWAASFEAPVNYREALYPLPLTWWESPTQPLKLVRARYKEVGIDQWREVSASWLPERYAVRVMFEPDTARTYEFTFAFPFLPPQGLTDELFDLGLTERSTQDLPPLRAAGRLALGVEGRRAQPYAQGDSRRPDEVPVTSSLGVERDFLREYDRSVMAEASRLQQLFAPKFAMGEPA